MFVQQARVETFEFKITALKWRVGGLFVTGDGTFGHGKGCAVTTVLKKSETQSVERHKILWILAQHLPNFFLIEHD